MVEKDGWREVAREGISKGIYDGWIQVWHGAYMLSIFETPQDYTRVPPTRIMTASSGMAWCCDAGVVY
jgi:hypothetical protein